MSGKWLAVVPGDVITLKSEYALREAQSFDDNDDLDQEDELSDEQEQDESSKNAKYRVIAVKTGKSNTPLVQIEYVNSSQGELDPAFELQKIKNISTIGGVKVKYRAGNYFTCSADLPEKHREYQLPQKGDTITFVMDTRLSGQDSVHMKQVEHEAEVTGVSVFDKNYTARGIVIECKIPETESIEDVGTKLQPGSELKVPLRCIRAIKSEIGGRNLHFDNEKFCEFYRADGSGYSSGLHHVIY